MKTVIFDIDGTLCLTSDTDRRCYAAAFEASFGQPIPSDDWHDYEHATDTGILMQALAECRGNGYSAEEMRGFQQRLMAAFEAEYAREPRGFLETPGAAALLERLSATGHAAALATGCLKRVAHFKLRSAGMDLAHLPGGYADDAISRGDIMRCAMERAGAVAADCVYIGDGLWDVVTCAALGVAFVGISAQSEAERLYRAGAGQVLRDFSDQAEFLEAVSCAAVPGSTVI